MVAERERLVAARAPAYSFSGYEERSGTSTRIAYETWPDDGGAEETIERDVVVE